jgi:hypothetical protein
MFLQKSHFLCKIPTRKRSALSPSQLYKEYPYVKGLKAQTPFYGKFIQNIIHMFDFLSRKQIQIKFSDGKVFRLVFVIRFRFMAFQLSILGYFFTNSSKWSGRGPYWSLTYTNSMSCSSYSS